VDGEEVVKALEDEVARMVVIIEARPTEPHEETFVAYNKGYLEGLEYAIGKTRALE
jgi:hypothetical protein